ncbi:MAG TPA: sulfite exporter TauE/SafE family protein [Acidobacteriaceae bacterium]|nr:sulfite exporter TauE/SafE family protein [Acidobacteriaceae bacterium]
MASLIRSSFGFGEALIAVPLLAFFIPIQVAAPLAVLLSITIAAIVVLQDWDKIHLRSAGWLVLATLPGLPLGLLVLTSGHQRIVRALLGLIIVAFSCSLLMRRSAAEPHHDSPVWRALCGFCAGVLGGAYGMNGPPLVIYASLRRWSPQQFRATLQAYFLPASLLAMAGYWATGLWTATVSHDYLLSLPAMVPAFFLGRFINRRLHGDAFLKFILAGLVCIGAVLVLQAVIR